MASRLAGHRWAGRMTWRDLLFAHWPVPSSVLRPHVPAGLEIDEFEGTAWLAVVPFAMTGIRARWLPALPWLSRTLELNVRTYVRAGSVSAVWFFSLDAASWPMVATARAVYHLNYLTARMSLHSHAGRIVYASRRTHRGALPAEFRGAYGPAGAPYLTKPGSLEHWLTERYALFATDRRGRLYRADIQHAPWPLQRAEADLELNTMTGQLGIQALRDRPLLHFAKSLEVRVWLPERLQ